MTMTTTTTTTTMTDPSSSKMILLAHPSKAFALGNGAANDEHTFLSLPHPRTGLPSLFVPCALPESSSQSTSADTDTAQTDATTDASDAGMLELQAIRPDAQRSWFLDGEGFGSGQVVSDGALHLLTPIDPAFLLLPILRAALPSDQTSGPGHYLAPDDLFERAALALGRRRATERRAAKARADPDANAENDESWEDVVRFGRTGAAKDALERVCDTQVIKSDLTTYRLSSSKLQNLLRAKVARLACAQTFANAPTTLGRALAKTGLGPDSEAEIGGSGTDGRPSSEKGEPEADARKEGEKQEKEKLRALARIRIASELVRGYVDEAAGAALLQSYDFAPLDAHISALEAVSEPVPYIMPAGLRAPGAASSSSLPTPAPSRSSSTSSAAGAGAKGTKRKANAELPKGTRSIQSFFGKGKK